MYGNMLWVLDDGEQKIEFSNKPGHYFYSADIRVDAEDGKSFFLIVFVGLSISQISPDREGAISPKIR